MGAILHIVKIDEADAAPAASAGSTILTMC
jgi:hypothetical protein